MDLILTMGLVQEAFKMGFNKAEIQVRDYINRCRIITLVDNEPCTIKRMEKLINDVGDGHQVIYFKMYQEEKDVCK